MCSPRFYCVKLAQNLDYDGSLRFKRHLYIGFRTTLNFQKVKVAQVFFETLLRLHLIILILSKFDIQTISSVMFSLIVSPTAEIKGVLSRS